MKIGKSDAFSLLSFLVFCAVLAMALVEVFSSIGWLDPNQHLEHWFVAVLLALYLPSLWRDAVPPKKTAMYQNAQAAKAYRKGQRAEQMARGMAGTDAFRDDEYPAGGALMGGGGGGAHPDTVKCIGIGPTGPIYRHHGRNLCPTGPIQPPPKD